MNDARAEETDWRNDLSEQRPSGVGATPQKGLDASVALGSETECMATRNLRTPSILLVSESVDDSQVHMSALRAWGYRVVNAETTILGYHIATTTPTDIVVTDGYCAGSMSGLELTRRLRIHSGTATVPIIVITSQTRRQDGELSIKAGANMFLERPVSGQVLREHVAPSFFLVNPSLFSASAIERVGCRWPRRRCFGA